MLAQTLLDRVYSDTLCSRLVWLSAILFPFLLHVLTLSFFYYMASYHHNLY
uniref:Uncharacterized protein n=1 Tax=Arundo donax TaxID=35708 RepID=A0A0A8XYU1_ARUDO